MGESIIPDSTLEALPILALRNSVLFPASVVPVNVGRPRSVRLIEEAFGADRPTIGVVAQRNSEDEDPAFSELYSMGTLARVLKVIRLSSGHYSVVLQGIARMRIVDPIRREPCLRARVERIYESPRRDEEIDALSGTVRETARDLMRTLPLPPREVHVVLDNVQEPGALCDLVSSHLQLETPQKQSVLENVELRERLHAVLDLLRRQGEIHRVKQEVATLVEEEMGKSQRELLLRQQLRTIRRELGESGDDDEVLDDLREALARATPPPEAIKAARRELSRMGSMNPSSAEFQVALSYVEWLTELPWNRSSKTRIDVAEVREVLDADHHGLEKPKRRVVEHIAVSKLRKDQRAPILCFVGPPGVGKTSLGRSIARATGREFVRIALGGVQDEAEIRGHRRTYVGAMPGRIITGLKKARTHNPVFVLDEIDKMGTGGGGDPASALLEALDPAQNDTFVDHYIDVAVDLSKVLFVATANRKDTIPGPLLDRLEVIDITGYTRDDKLAIARDFLVPKQLSEHGLTPEQLEMSDSALERLVLEYTYEAGVRQLSQEIASVCRSVAVRVTNGEDVHIDADGNFIQKVLGAPKYDVQRAEKTGRPGVAPTLSWTPVGGELLQVETTLMPGQGSVHLTGQMGGIMKESATAAITYIRAHADEFGLEEDFMDSQDMHVHMPKGALPRDTPSMGLSILISVLSSLQKIDVRPDIAVTGEISLRGKVLRVEGLMQKCLAAHQAGIGHVIVPRANEFELSEIPSSVRSDIHVHLVGRVDEAIKLAFASA